MFVLFHIVLLVCSGLSAHLFWFSLSCFTLCRCGWWLYSCTAGNGLSSTTKTCRSTAAPPQLGPLCTLVHNTPAHIHLVPAETYLNAFQKMDTSVSKFLNSYLWVGSFELWAFFCDIVNFTIASPSSSPRDAIFRIKMAEVWGGCKIHKVSGSRGFDVGVTGEKSWPGSNTSQSNLEGQWCHNGSFLYSGQQSYTK